MPRRERHMFAERVADGAESATAALVVGFGDKVVEIKRQLSDLALVSFSIDGNLVNLEKRASSAKAEDARYHDEIIGLLGLASFFDVLIVLHFLVFMLEDRRALVWDSNAQRQIFRVLLLPAARATEHAKAQQEVISADSAVRNTRSLITRHQGEKKAAKAQSRVIAEAEAERHVLVAQANAIREEIETVAANRSRADTERHNARLDRLRGAEVRDSLRRELERIKMATLGTQLGPSPDTLRYILGQLLADKACIVCGTNPSPAEPQVHKWVQTGRCPICGSTHETPERVIRLTDKDRKRLPRLETEIQLAEEQIAQAETRIAEAHGRFVEADAQFEALERRRISLDARLIAVLKRIPAARAAGSVVSDLEALRRILANEQRRLRAAEKRFRKVNMMSLKSVQLLQKDIAKSFRHYLRVFMREDAELVYRTVKERVGQSGDAFDFPSFHLAMTGGAVAGRTVREGPDAVSQSQREFVDLAFRMALMTVAGEGSAATLLVDAPEASLDFLFAERAGEQLAAFATANKYNRVVVTSYLPSDHFIRKFLGDSASASERQSRIVDLISIAAPNAALRADRARYERFLAKVIRGSAASNA